LTTTPAATTAPFTIQVAASTNARYAQKMVDELKRAGHAAYLVEPAASGPGGPYHVRVGRYPTLVEANRSALTLEKALGWRLSIAAAGLHGSGGRGL
jgi:cell division septation protein DedD